MSHPGINDWNNEQSRKQRELENAARIAAVAPTPEEEFDEGARDLAEVISQVRFWTLVSGYLALALGIIFLS